MDVGNWIQILVTVVLVGITGWYAWETRRIVRNMEQDREDMHRPLLTFQLISWQPKLLKLRIQNVGSGVAVDVDGSIESILKAGTQVSFPWSHPLLCASQFEEFGFPMPKSNISRFDIDAIRDNITDVRAHFIYYSSQGNEYELNETIPLQKITEDWIASRMLVTQDHPDRIMPRIAKTLERIDGSLKKLNVKNK